MFAATMSAFTTAFLFFGNSGRFPNAVIDLYDKTHIHTHRAGVGIYTVYPVTYTHKSLIKRTQQR